MNLSEMFTICVLVIGSMIPLGLYELFLFYIKAADKHVGRRFLIPVIVTEITLFMVFEKTGSFPLVAGLEAAAAFLMVVAFLLIAIGRDLGRAEKEKEEKEAVNWDLIRERSKKIEA